MNDQNYGDYQSPDGGYGGSQQPGALYAGKGGATLKPTAPGGSPATAKVGPAKSVIHVSVNPISKISPAAFVDLINKTPGTVPEFKGKISLDKKTNTIAVPDYSQNKVVPGKEWLFDLGKAGNDWEITTATLLVDLDGPTSMSFQEDLAGGDERGEPEDPNDPDTSLTKLSPDFIGSPVVNRGIPLGLTIPNQAMYAKNSALSKIFPKIHIARLKSGKGLILITRQVKVGKGVRETKDGVAIPKVMMAMSFFHELAAHASFFQLGQNAEHNEPLVDRNRTQAEASFVPFVAKEQDAFQKKVMAHIDAMYKASQ
jgi:hypothetical protein